MDIPGIDPFVFRIGPFGVRWYGFFMALSIGLGIWYLITRGRHHRLSEDFLYNLALLSVVGGIVGSRLVYVLTNLGYFTANPVMILRMDMGGLSFHGAIGGGVLVGWWYAWRNKVPVPPLLDLSIPGIATGIILVRIGNIFNREILGFHADILGGARHPAQLYGSAIGVVLWLIYAYQTEHGRPDGYRFWTAVFWYSLLRGVNEFFRVQNPHFIFSYTNAYWGIGMVTLTQWITPVFLVIAWVFMRRSARANQHWMASPGSPAYQPAPGEEPPGEENGNQGDESGKLGEESH